MIFYEGSLCVRILKGAALGGGNPWLEPKQESQKFTVWAELEVVKESTHLIRIYRQSRICRTAFLGGG